MATTKRIVCLANSRRPDGRCVAGKELLTGGRSGGWIRPVSSRENGEVSLAEQRYQDRSLPQLLDVLEIRFLRAQPSYHQKENWVLDRQCRWTRNTRMAWSDLAELSDTPPQLWVNGHSTSRGENDKVPLHIARHQNSSLQLLKVDSMEMVVLDDLRQRRRVQGRFRYKGIDYWLWVTDPVCEYSYLNQPSGTYPIGKTYLTISLSEQFYNPGASTWDCYKLIAGVMVKGMIR